jgi:hypothetical protein
MPTPKPPQRTLYKDKIAAGAAKYLLAHAEEKKASDTKKTVGSELKELLNQHAPALNEKGDRKIEANGFEVSTTVPESKKLKQDEAITLLKKKGLLERCTKKVVDDSEIEKCFQEGLLDLDELKDITETVYGTPRIGVKKI